MHKFSDKKIRYFFGFLIGKIRVSFFRFNYLQLISEILIQKLMEAKLKLN